MCYRQWTLWNSVSLRLAIGCRPIVWNLMPKRLSCSGPVQDSMLHVFYVTTTWLWHLEGRNLTVKAADAVRVLGVLFTPDLALDKHAVTVSAKCFPVAPTASCTSFTGQWKCSDIGPCVCDQPYRLWQFANATKSRTDKLQRVLNAAARVISGTRKFDRGLSRIIRDDLHWLNIPQRVTFKVCMTVYKSTPPYLAELCVSVADDGARRRLRSASRRTVTLYDSIYRASVASRGKSGPRDLDHALFKGDLSFLYWDLIWPTCIQSLITDHALSGMICHQCYQIWNLYRYFTRIWKAIQNVENRAISGS